MKKKIEIDTPDLVSICTTILSSYGTLSLVSRSSGSGETVHAWVKRTSKGYFARTSISSKQTEFHPEDLDAIINKWLDRASGIHDHKANTFTRVGFDQASKTPRGLFTYYIRATVA